MAQYAETIYASDSWQQNYQNLEPTTTSKGTALTSKAQFSFTYDGMPYLLYANSESRIKIPFGLPAKYGKKRLIKAEGYAYVTARSHTASGTPKSGSHNASYDDGEESLFLEDNAYMGLPPLTGLALNQYNRFCLYESSSGGNTHLQKIAAGTYVFRPTVLVGCSGELSQGMRYSATGQITIQSHTGANRPYLALTLEDVVPRVVDTAPKSGFVNEKSVNTFHWRFDYSSSAVAETLSQRAYQFRWRQTGTTANHDATVTSQNPSHTVAANTFPASAGIDWCVRVQSNDGIWSEWSDWHTLTTVDSLSTPARLQPDLCYVDGNLAQTFSWQHVIATGTAQQKYELQYSTDEGASWKQLTAASASQTQAAIPADILPAGRVLWRVRTANSDGVWGSWSENASIVVRAKPAPPSIGQLDVVPALVVRWQAADQMGYQVQAGPLDSKERYGAAKEWRSPRLLEDGDHLIRVRVKNSFGLWSDWDQSQIRIQNNGRGSILLSARQQGYETHLSWTASGDFTGYLIRRNGEDIAEVDETDYTDLFGHGKQRYQVLGLLADGNYVKSEEKTVLFQLEEGAIRDQEEGEWIPLQVGKNGPPAHRVENEAQVAYSHYYGGALPMAEIARGRNRRDQITFALPDNLHLALLQRLLGRPVVLKEPWGGALAGVLDGLTADLSKDSDLTLTITETDREGAYEK